jgi:UDP-glucose 4-epimerase
MERAGVERSAGAGVAPLDLPGERVVVIGGGFLGSRIAERAVGLGRRTVVFTRRGASAPVLIAAGCRVVVGDAADADAVQGLLRRPAHVVFCAGGRLPTNSIDDPAGDAVGTVAPLLCVLEAMRAHPGSRLTLLSSGGTVYGRPSTIPVEEDHPCHPLVPYGVSRLAAEGYTSVYASLHRVPARILRLGNVYGPGQPGGRRQGLVAALFSAAQTGEPVEIWGDGRIARDYVHVADVADVVHRLSSPLAAPEILNVGTGVAHTVLAVAAAVERVTGAALQLEMYPGRPYDVEHIALSTRRLASLIAYTPLTLEKGLRATWAARLLDTEDASAAEGR